MEQTIEITSRRYVVARGNSCFCCEVEFNGVTKVDCMGVDICSRCYNSFLKSHYIKFPSSGNVEVVLVPDLVGFRLYGIPKRSIELLSDFDLSLEGRLNYLVASSVIESLEDTLGRIEMGIS